LIKILISSRFSS